MPLRHGRRPRTFTLALPVALALLAGTPTAWAAESDPAPASAPAVPSEPTEPTEPAEPPPAEPSETPPAEPAPVEPAPVEPAPVEPAPVEPAPAAPVAASVESADTPAQAPAAVVPVLAVSTSKLPGATWGKSYSRTLGASGGKSGYTWVRATGSLPEGLKLAANGRITGTPTKVGTSKVGVRVTDAAGTTAVRTLSIVTKATLDVALSTPSTSSLKYSYREGCPVEPSGLRTIAMNYWGFDGEPHRGELIARKSAVDDLTDVFAKAFDAKFPINEMVRVDKYKGSDVASMEADNTSAFNCRHVTGNPTRLSQHSYGNAIDINTLENPYVTDDEVYPSKSEPFLDRSPYRKGMIVKSGSVAKGMAHEDWKWGARWRNPDYQHFSANGG